MGKIRIYPSKIGVVSVQNYDSMTATPVLGFNENSQLQTNHFLALNFDTVPEIIAKNITTVSIGFRASSLGMTLFYSTEKYADNNVTFSYKSIVDGSFSDEYKARLLIKKQSSTPQNIFFTGSVYLGKHPNSSQVTGLYMNSQGVYLDVEFEDVDIKATDFSPPSNSYVKPHESTTFSWNIGWNNDHIPGGVYQQKAEIYIAPIAENFPATPNFTVNGNANNHSIPPGFFSNISNYKWGIRLTGTNGITQNMASVIAVEPIFTTDFTPEKPTDLTPKSDYVNGGIDNIFSWVHVNESGSEQTAFDIQISVGGGGWQDLKNEVTERQNYTIPTDTLPSGNVKWRVRTYNIDSVPGDWSDPAEIIVRGTVPTPIITNSDGKPRLHITWQSHDQQAFEVTANDYSSGTIYSTDKHFKFPVFLEGTQKIGLRIQNSMGQWSDFSTISVTIENIENIENESITAIVHEKNNSVYLSWITAGNYHFFAVYRNNIIIGETKELSFIDNLSNGKNTYKIRGVTSNEYYTFSNEAHSILKIDGTVLAPLEDNGSPFDWMQLKLKKDAYPSRNFAHSANISYIHYSGRSLPVAYTNGEKNYSYSCNYTLMSRKNLEKIIGNIGRNICLKDCRGNLIIGVLDAVNVTNERYFDVSLNVTATSYINEISYVVPIQNSSEDSAEDDVSSGVIIPDD